MATQERIELAVEPRTIIGKKVAQLRRAGMMPATVYGKKQEPIAVQLTSRAFSDILRKAGRTRLLYITIAGRAPIAAFIHLLQRHPVSRNILHADFRAVDLLVEITVEVPVHIVGTSEVVQRGDATFNTVHQTLNVRALPTAVPQSIDVDVSSLDELGKGIFVRDLVMPEGVTIELDPDELIVALSESRLAEEEETTTDAAAEPEVITEKKDDE